MSCSVTGTTASWQPQYAGPPTAYYPDAAYAQPSYALSPYATSPYGGPVDASSMQIGTLISQLSALMQALQGVVMNLGAGAQGGYASAPSAYPGAQQFGMPGNDNGGVLYPSLDGPVPYYSRTPNGPGQSAPPAPGKAGSSSCGCGCGGASCGHSPGQVPDQEYRPSPRPMPTPAPPLPVPDSDPVPERDPAPAPAPPPPPPAPAPAPAPSPEQSTGIPPGADWRWIKERGETLFGLRNDDGDSQTIGGQHGAKSEHYRGRAVDFGDAKNSREKLNAWAEWAKQQGLDVLDEGDHIHVSMPGQGI